MFNKLILLLKAIIYTFYFKFKNLYSKKKISLEHPVLVVSLTCFPARIDKVFYTIESLFNQSFNCNFEVRLYLSLTEFKDKKLPFSLERLVLRNLKIFFVENNLKSYKKLFYSYGTTKLPIITVDDDIFYPNNWLSSIYDSHLRYPEDIIYMRGRTILFDENKSIKNYFNFPQAAGYKRSFLTIPTGVSGILYPSGSLHEDWCRLDLFTKLAPTADDLWFKVMSLINNRKCFLANSFSIHYPPILGSQVISLKNINVNDGYSANDQQLIALLDFYNIDLNSYTLD